MSVAKARAGVLSDEVVARFWARAVKRDGCWEWTGGWNGTGVRARPVVVRWSRPKLSRVLASRVSWEIHRGPIPDGLCVLHHCDNPECTNPDHLFLGTVLDNNRDRHEKGRSRGGSSPGVLSPHAKLTAEQVTELRAARAAGARHCDLARRFGVTRETVRDIAKRRIWRHVP